MFFLFSDAGSAARFADSVGDGSTHYGTKPIMEFADGIEGICSGESTEGKFMDEHEHECVNGAKCKCFEKCVLISPILII